MDKNNRTKDRMEQTLAAYDTSEQELRSHWLWSLCQIAPGDWETLIRRLEDRCQGIMDLSNLKAQARTTLESQRTPPPKMPTISLNYLRV